MKLVGSKLPPMHPLSNPMLGHLLLLLLLILLLLFLSRTATA